MHSEMRLGDSAGKALKTQQERLASVNSSAWGPKKQEVPVWRARALCNTKALLQSLVSVCPLPSAHPCLKNALPFFCSIRESTLHLADGPEVPGTTYRMLAVAFIMKIEAALEDEALYPALKMLRSKIQSEVQKTVKV